MCQALQCSCKQVLAHLVLSVTLYCNLEVISLTGSHECEEILDLSRMKKLPIRCFIRFERLNKNVFFI
jgi:hypothetical protein